MNFYLISALVFVVILALAVLLYSYKIHFWKYAFKRQTKMPDAEQNKDYLILIPARDESAIIADTLDGIACQTYDKSRLHTLVIVEDQGDPTIEICKKYQSVESYVLPYAPGSKGGALDLAIKELAKNKKHYDGYFVIDADNVIEKDFVKHMHDAFCAGNDVVLGAKQIKKPSGQWVSMGNEFTMTLVNSMNNKCRTENGQNVVLQGTPLLISSKIIEEYWGGTWPLTTLAEDYELSIVCSIGGFKSCYYEHAKSYYEAPTSYRESFKQRLRWLKGHNSVDFKYAKQMTHIDNKHDKGIYKFDTIFSLAPPIIIIVSSFLFAIYSLVCTVVLAAIGSSLWVWALIGFLGTFFGFYLLMCFWTLFAMAADETRTKLSAKDKAKLFFTTPLYFMSYFPIFVKSLVTKEVKWTKIKCD